MERMKVGKVSVVGGCPKYLAGPRLLIALFLVVNRRTIIPPMALSTKPLPYGTLATKTGYATLFSERRCFSKQRTLSCRLCIAPVAALSRLVGSIGLPATCTLLEISLGEGGPSRARIVLSAGWLAPLLVFLFRPFFC